MATRIFIVGGCVCTTLSVYLVIHLINLSHVVQHCFMFAIFGRALLQCVVVATTSATFWTLCSLSHRVLNDTPTLDGYFFVFACRVCSIPSAGCTCPAEFWILVDSSKVFTVVVFDQGAIFVAIYVHDTLHAEDFLLAISNKLYSFSGPEIIHTHVLFLAQSFYNGVSVRGLVELLDKLLRSLELFEICGEVHFLLLWVNEILISLTKTGDWFPASPLIEIDILK